MELWSLSLTRPAANSQGCCLTNISGAQKGKSQNVRSPTGNVLGAAANIYAPKGLCWVPQAAGLSLGSSLDSHENLLEQKNVFTLQKSLSPRGLV